MRVYRSGDTAVHRLVLGPLKTNCYIVETGAGAFVLDPVADADTIAAYCDANQIVLSFGMLTHAHFDHVGAAAGLIAGKRISALWFHPADAGELARVNTYALLIAKKRLELPPKEACRHFDAAFEQMLAGMGFAFEHLPGHTPGSCIVHSLDRKMVFTGDIILNNRVPGVRTAIGENRDQMRAAVARIAEAFQPRTLVLPGHGDLTVLETELAYNRTVKSLLEEVA